MGHKNTRYLEKKILENADQLIECAIAASLLSNEAKEKELKRGVDLIVEITGYLKELIDVNDEYLPEILNQIISQKLPDNKVQQTLGTFNQELAQMLCMGLNAQTQRPCEDFEPLPVRDTPAQVEPLEAGGGQSQEPDNTPVSEVELGSLALEELSEELLEVNNATEFSDLHPQIEENWQSPEETIGDINVAVEEDSAGQPQEQGGILLSDLLNRTEDFSKGIDGLETDNVTQSAYDSLEGIQESQRIHESQESIREPQESIQEPQEDAEDVVAALAPVAEPEPELEPTVIKQRRGLALSLSLIFPTAEILQNVYLDGVCFAFYLPGMKLAIDQTVSVSEYELKQKLCNQEGIDYHIIDAESGINYRRVERILQRKRSKPKK